MKNNRSIFVVIAIVMLLQLVSVPIIESDDTKYYTELSPKYYKMKNTYELKNIGSNEAFDVKATIFVGPASDSPYQQNVTYKVTPWPKYTYVDSSGNIYAEIYIDKIKAVETKIITVEKELVNSGISYEDDIYSLKADYGEFKKKINNKQYLLPGDKVESTASEILFKAASFDKDRTKVNLAKDIYDFVNLYIKYDTSKAYANKGALSAMRTAKGVCDEYATLFTALSRAVGIPARVVSGYWIDKDEPLRAGIWNDVSSKSHGWAEFYLPGAGWIPVEPTFIYTFNGVRTPNSDYFANMLSDDTHLINKYQQNQPRLLDTTFAYYKPTTLQMDYGDDFVMPLSSISRGHAFTDISSSWAVNYIDRLYAAGIVFGKQPGLFKPLDRITRAEFSAYLVNTLRLDHKDSGTTFKDVKDSTEYANFIETAAAYKLILGDQGYFKPEDPITRQDAATIMKRAIELLNEDDATLQNLRFADNKQISSYANEAVKLIYSMGIMNGKPGNMFEPKSYTTRAEAVKILDNFINATEK